MGIRQRLSNTTAGFALGIVFCLGLLAAHWLSNPFGALSSFNPFHFSTTIAPTGPVVLQQVQQLQRLETCRFTEQVIVRGDDDSSLPRWLVGDHILFVGNGEAVAGIDLSKLKPEDVRVEGDKATLRLPSAEILHVRLDNKGSQVYDRQTGIFNRPDMNLETKVRQDAEERIRNAAIEGGILKTATDNAQETLRKQLHALGFGTVDFLS